MPRKISHIREDGFSYEKKYCYPSNEATPEPKPQKCCTDMKTIALGKWVDFYVELVINLLIIFKHQLLTWKTDKKKFAKSEKADIPHNRKAVQIILNTFHNKFIDNTCSIKV